MKGGERNQRGGGRGRKRKKEKEMEGKTWALISFNKFVYTSSLFEGLISEPNPTKSFPY